MTAKRHRTVSSDRALKTRPGKKILLAVTSERSVRLFSSLPQLLAQRGNEVHVVSNPGPQLTELNRDELIHCHGLTMSRDPSVADLRSLWSWVRLLRQVRPDVISVGTPKAGLLGIVAGFLTRVPARVYLLRGLRYETERGIKRSILKTLERISIKLSHVTQSVSKTAVDRAVADRLGPRRKFIVLGAGSSGGVHVGQYETSPQQRAELQRKRWGDPQLPVVGFVGRITADKGMDLLADAIEILGRQGTIGRLVLVGSSEGYDANALLRRIEAVGWQGEATGFLPDPTMEFKHLDVLCLPTRREGFPSVVLQAAAAGVPTVATLATGIPDAIVNGRTGLVVSTRSPVDFAKALGLLLQNPKVRNRLANNAHERVAKEFEASRVMGLTAEFLETFRK